MSVKKKTTARAHLHVADQAEVESLTPAIKRLLTTFLKQDAERSFSREAFPARTWSGHRPSSSGR